MRAPLLPALLALLLAPAAFAPPAAADPFTDHFQPVLVELIARDAALPFPAENALQRRQRAAITRCYNLLGVLSANLAGDLRIARRVAASIKVGFPGDAPFAAILEELDSDLGADADVVRDEVADTVLLLAESRIKTRATARIAQADALWGQAEIETDAVRRARFRQRSHSKVVGAAALAAKGQPEPPVEGSLMTATVAGLPWAANNDFGTGVSGVVDVSDTNGGVRRIRVTGRRILPSTLPPEHPGDPPLPGDTSEIRFTITRVSQDLVAGATYTVGNADGVSTTASWFAEDEDGTVHNAVPLSGSISIDTIVLEFGQATVTGTFEFTMYDGVAAESFDIAGGAFEALDVPRVNVP